MTRRTLLGGLAIVALLTGGMTAVGPWGARAAPAMTTKGLEIVGVLGGEVTAVAVDGRWVYAAMGGRVVVLDAETTASPRLVGETAFLGESLVDLAIRDGHVFVSDPTFGLRVVDVRVPSEPRPVSDLLLEGVSGRLVVSGTIGYVAGGGSGLHLVDLSDPSRPRTLGRLPTRRFTRGVAVSGSYAYVAERDDWEAVLRVVNISDPAAPLEVGSVDTPGGADAVTVAGRYAYVLGVTGRLWVVEVADATHPERRGVATMGGDQPVGPSLPTTGPPSWDVLVQEDHAYVARGTAGVDVVDIRFAGRPLVLTTVDTPGESRALALRGLRGPLFVADGSSGVQVLDVDPPAEAIVVGVYETPGLVRDLVASETVLAVLTDREVRTIDITHAAQPVLRGTAPVTGTPTCLAAITETGRSAATWLVVGALPALLNVRVGNRYESQPRGGLEVFDARVVEAPRKAGGLDGVRVTALAVAAKQAWVGSRWIEEGPPVQSLSGIRGFRLDDPRTPTEGGRVALGREPVDVAVIADGAALLVALANNNALVIVDTTDGEAPREIGRVTLPWGVTAIAPLGRRGFVAVALTNRSLAIVDVGAPVSPHLVGTLALDAQPTGIASIDGFVVMSLGRRGVALVDAREPTAPRLLEMAPGVGGSAGPVGTDGSLVYVGLAPAAVVVLRFVDREVTPTPTPSSTPTATTTPTATVLPSPSSMTPGTPRPRFVFAPFVRR